MIWFRENWRYFVLALAVAFGVHVASIAITPRLVMTIALNKMSASHGFNTMLQTPRPTSASRGVVRPSPDLLYSACPFDLDKLPDHVLRVHADHMPGTYWSVSVFDAGTSNIFALNDRQAKNGAVDFTIVGPRQDKMPLTPAVRSPTSRGLVLFRTLIDSDLHLAALDAARRHATCAPF